MRELYDQWLADSSVAKFTPAGNRKKPSNDEIVDMVVESWNSLSEDLIRNSFLAVGQAVEAQPQNISCMKEGRPVRDALEEVSQLWNKSVSELTDIEMIEEADLEEDEKNNDGTLFDVEEIEEDIVIE